MPLWSLRAVQKWYRAVGTTACAALAWTIRVTLPPSCWYRAAFQLSRAMLPLFRPRRNWAWNGALSQAVFVNRVLSLLTRTGRPFPVPWRAEGLDLVRAAAACPRGLILCSAHLLPIKVACLALMDSGIPVDAAITDNPSVVDSLAVWGRIDRMPAIQAGRNVLLRTRSVLKQAVAVLLLADASPGAPLQPNIFRLAGRLQSRVVLFSAELRRDGIVAVRFFEVSTATPSFQMAALQAEMDRIRRG